MLPLVKRILIFSFLLICAFNAQAVVCTSTGDGDWEVAGTWSCGRVPQAGDTIIIQAGDSVTISTNISLVGSPVILTVQAGATLHFLGGGAKLDLPCGSEVYVYGRWSTSGSGGGSSQTLKICGSTFWRKSDGNISGPQFFPAGLPVKLLSFTGELQDNKSVLLEWITQTEVNNSHFEVQKSVNGAEFTTFTTATGAGNSAVVVNYSKVDEQPYVPVTYYRLKQVDFNGAFTYSPIISVVVNEFVMSNVWPNPAKENIEFILNSDHAGSASIVIQSIEGKKVQTLDYSYMKGANRQQVDISQLAPGSYFVIIRDNVSDAHTFKQLKVK